MKSQIAQIRWTIRNLARLFSYWLFRKCFEDAVVSWNPGIIHAHDSMALPLAAKAAKRCDAKLIFDSHELETHRNPPQLWLNRAQIRWIEKRILPQATKVLTVSEKIADHLQREYAIERPEVIFNSPPIGKWPVADRWKQPQRADVRSEAGVSEATLLLVYTGNVATGRGIEETLKGLAQFNAESSLQRPVHISIVGKATDATHANLLKLAETLGVSGQLHFHPPVAANDVHRFISTASISVIPIIPQTLSYDYAMPNKLFEAALSGLPILGADLAEMGAFIEMHELGVTYDSRDANAFSRALKQLIAQLDKRNASHRPTSKFTKHFSWEGQAAKLVKIYGDL